MLASCFLLVWGHHSRLDGLAERLVSVVYKDFCPVLIQGSWEFYGHVNKEDERRNMSYVAEQEEVPACNEEAALLNWSVGRAVPITIQGEAGRVGYSKWKEDGYVDGNKLLSCKDISDLHAIQSATEN